VYTYFGFFSLVSSRFFIFISCICTISHLISPILILISCTIRRASPTITISHPLALNFHFRHPSIQIHGHSDTQRSGHSCVPHHRRGRYIYYNTIRYGVQR
jgi:hypothetical protein